MLKVLLIHSGEWVRYEQMIAEAWSGTLVSQHTIDVTVGEVKRSLQEYGKWIGNRPKVGYCLDVPRSDELVRRGWHFWNQRTREGLERAIDSFEQAAIQCPSDFRAFEGLSASFLTLVTFGIRPPAEMHTRFLEAHGRAEALCGLTPDLRCNRAHGLHIFERRIAEAESELLRTIEEKPTLASAYVRLALLYGSLGRLEKSATWCNRAHAADPLWPVVSMMECNVCFWRRDFEGAVAVGRNAVALHPYLQAARAIYAQALEFSGKLDEALAQYQTRLVAGAGPAVGARARGRLSRQDGAHRGGVRRFSTRSSSFAPPSTWMRSTWRFCASEVGQLDEAFDELERAGRENSAWLYSLNVDPKIDPFRKDARYDRLRGRLFGSHVGQRTAAS